MYRIKKILGFLSILDKNMKVAIYTYCMYVYALGYLNIYGLYIQHV